MKVRITVEDQGKIYEGEVELEPKGKAKENPKPKKTQNNWYQKGSITEKLVQQINEGFFDENRTISDMILNFKTKDFHFKSKDLTRPLRTIVRRDLLTKTKDLPDGTKSSHWTYIKK